MTGYVIGFFDGGTWHQEHGANVQGWLSFFADLAAWFALLAVPSALAYWMIRRKNPPSARLVWLPSVLIVVCGVTHLIDVSLGVGAFGVGLVPKLVTAIVGWAMVFAFLPWLPRVANANALARINRRLEKELGERQRETAGSIERQKDLEAQIARQAAALDVAEEQLETAIKQRLVAEQNLLAEFSDKWSKVDQEFEDLAYIASHDLKEPLRGISNYSSFLIEDYGDKLDAEGRAKLQTLQNLSERLELLIDSMLAFSRVGREKLALREIDLNEIVAGVLLSVRAMLKEREIEVRIPRPLPTIQCDHRQTLEIFRNLITNAVKYNDKPERWIEIGYYEEANGERTNGEQPYRDMPGPTDHSHPGGPDREGSRCPKRYRLVLYVRDNGIGIQERHHDSIFRIFKRLHGRDRFGGGTGAGLTIAKRIIERHKGRIWVESKHGEGSTFHFMLSGG